MCTEELGGGGVSYSEWLYVNILYGMELWWVRYLFVVAILFVLLVGRRSSITKPGSELNAV